MPADSVPVRALLAVSSQEGEGSGLPLFFSGHNPIMGTHRLPSSKPNHFPQAPPPNTITLGLGLQHMNFGGTLFILQHPASENTEQSTKYGAGHSVGPFLCVPKAGTLWEESIHR